MIAQGRFLAFSVVLLLAGTRLALADSTAAPAPAASSAPPATAAATPVIPKNFDPCGGPLELLNKIGNGTACVFVAGEGAATAQYSSANIPANSQINIGAGGRSLGLSTYAHAFGYPASVLYVGVLPRAQVAITLPSFAQINSSTLGAITGNNVLAAGATDMKFEYKQLAYVNLQKFTMAAVAFDYDAPTGSPVFSGSGPSYTVNPMVTQPLPHNYGVTLAFPITNAVGALPGAARGWNWTPQFIPYWESTGGTLVAVVVQHSFNPNATPLVVSVAQLFGRHFEVSAAYGGFTYSASTNGAFGGLVNTTTTAYPSLITIGINYLIGRSDLPAALQ